jgi:hypothetical protein
MAFNLKGWKTYPGSEHERICDRFNLGIRHAFSASPDPLSDKAQLTALMLLLDKAYSAGLRRTTKGWEEYGSPTDMIVGRLYGNGKYRKQFEQFATFDAQTLNSKMLDDIARRVDGLAELVSTVNGSQRRPLSFSSKFLHYRSGIVPIWDDLARSGLRAVVGGTRYTAYIDYAGDFLELLRHLFGGDSFDPVQIKQLDNYLIRRGDQKR